MNYKDMKNMTPEQRKEDDKNFSFEVVEEIAVVGGFGNTSKELNRISWRGKSPKYDLRLWEYDGDEKRLGKGITLSGAELKKLKSVLLNLDIKIDDDPEPQVKIDKTKKNYSGRRRFTSKERLNG